MYLNPKVAGAGSFLRPVFVSLSRISIKKGTTVGFQTIETLTPPQKRILNYIIKYNHLELTLKLCF